VDLTVMQARLDAAPVGRLATVRPDGGPHVVPCCYARLGATIFSAVDAKPKSTRALQRLANIRARPAASLLVDHYEDDWSALWWVRVDGTAQVVEGREPAAAYEALAAKYPAYRTTPPAGPLVALAIEVWRGWP
jgi:PPOX class probable F420-dependent enzyme